MLSFSLSFPFRSRRLLDGAHAVAEGRRSLQLPAGPGEMPLDRPRAQAQLLRDRLGGAAIGDEQDDVLLDGRELGRGQRPSFQLTAAPSRTPLTRR